MCLITTEQPYKLNFIYFYGDDRVDIKNSIPDCISREFLFFIHHLLVLSVQKGPTHFCNPP